MTFPISRKTVLVILLVLFSSFSLGSFAKNRSQGGESVVPDLELFSKVVHKVKTFYVDDVDTHELIIEAIEAMLADLDPHSQYLADLDYEDLMVSTQGQFGGLGIFISFRDNYPTVISPIEGTPADRAGIQGGDQIVEIEGEPAEGWRVQKAVRYLRGDPGTAVRFKVSRPGLDEPIEYNLVREKIKVKSVSYYGMFGDQGYVKLSSFSKTSRDELHNALRDLESQEMKGLVLDLRSNPGGLLQAAKSVAELFLEKDKLVVYTKGRYEDHNQKYYAGKSRKHAGYPIVVMINGASASASEIVAGALQDWDAGFVVGQTSFGKGTVQTVFPLTDTQAVKLTTAKYYTPSGRSIHKDEPKDEELAQGSADRADLAQSSAVRTDLSDDATREQTMDQSGLEEIDRPIFHTSGGRVVYGGGGITPDLEFEPKEYGDLERRLERDGLFFTFAIDYSTKNEVKEDFEVNEDILNRFKGLIRDRGFEFEEEEFSGGSLEYVKKAITREIVSKNFGRQAMYRVLLEKDEEFQRVLEICQMAPTLAEMYTYAERERALKKASVE
ncbi:MAG: S41 family peptidase [Candidatus Latescibacterota bacterium]|nr:MAG: S41 family peptidase [Candidatus Latescibacterota bacterium]